MTTQRTTQSTSTRPSSEWIAITEIQVDGITNSMRAVDVGADGVATPPTSLEQASPADMLAAQIEHLAIVLTQDGETSPAGLIDLALERLGYFTDEARSDAARNGD